MGRDEKMFRFFRATFVIVFFLPLVILNALATFGKDNSSAILLIKNLGRWIPVWYAVSLILLIPIMRLKRSMRNEMVRTAAAADREASEGAGRILAEKQKRSRTLTWSIVAGTIILIVSYEAPGEWFVFGFLVSVAVMVVPTIVMGFRKER